MSNLGDRLQLGVWCVRSVKPPDAMARVLRGVVRTIGMHHNDMPPAVWQYPLPDGRGGIGHTICLPYGQNMPLSRWQRFKFRLAAWILGRQRFASMVFQPLTESFVISDDYPELNKTYIVLCSCVPFNAHSVTRYLIKTMGPDVHLKELII